MTKPLTLIALTLLGVCLGYFLVLLLPAVLAAWLIMRDHKRRTSADRPPVCDPEALSPVWDSEAWIAGWEQKLRERTTK